MTSKEPKVGFVVAGGGSAFSAALNIASGSLVEAVAITRTACDAEKKATECGIPVHRLEATSATRFSANLRDFAVANDLLTYVFLFDRLVSREVFDALPCINVHPSLLPSFAGKDAVKKCLESGCLFVGASAHIIDDSVDGGPILAQTVRPIPRGMTLDDVNAVSFLQKVLITLVVLERVRQLYVRNEKFSVNSIISAFASDNSYSHSTSPCLLDPQVRSKFADLQNMRGFQVDAVSQ